MKYFLILGVILLMAAYGCDEQKQTQTISDSKTEMMHQDKDQAAKIYYYTCPMEEHKHIHSDIKGKCSECNMDLVAAESTEVENASYFGCPMQTHSHVRHKEAGKCDECSMDLKPMRLNSNL